MSQTTVLTTVQMGEWSSQSQSQSQGFSRGKFDNDELETKIEYGRQKTDRIIPTSQGVQKTAMVYGIDVRQKLWGQSLLDKVGELTRGLPETQDGLVSVIPDEIVLYLSTSLNATIQMVDETNHSYTAQGPHSVLNPPYKTSSYNVRCFSAPLENGKPQFVGEIDMVCAGLTSLYLLAKFLVLVLEPPSADHILARQYKLIAYLARNNPVELRTKMMNENADPKQVKHTFNLQSVTTATRETIFLDDVDSPDERIQLNDTVLALTKAFTEDGIVGRLTSEWFRPTVSRMWQDRFKMNMQTFIPVLANKRKEQRAHLLKNVFQSFIMITAYAELTQSDLCDRLLPLGNDGFVATINPEEFESCKELTSEIEILIKNCNGRISDELSRCYIPRVEAMPGNANDYFLRFDDSHIDLGFYSSELRFFGFKDMNTAVIGSESFPMNFTFESRQCEFVEHVVVDNDVGSDMDYDGSDDDGDDVQSNLGYPSSPIDDHGSIVFGEEDDCREGVVFSTPRGFGSPALLKEVGNRIFNALLDMVDLFKHKKSNQRKIFVAYLTKLMALVFEKYAMFVRHRVEADGAIHIVYTPVPVTLSHRIEAGQLHPSILVRSGISSHAMVVARELKGSNIDFEPNRICEKAGPVTTLNDIISSTYDALSPSMDLLGEEGKLPHFLMPQFMKFVHDLISYDHVKVTAPIEWPVRRETNLPDSTKCVGDYVAGYSQFGDPTCPYVYGKFFVYGPQIELHPHSSIVFTTKPTGSICNPYGDYNTYAERQGRLCGQESMENTFETILADFGTLPVTNTTPGNVIQHLRLLLGKLAVHGPAFLHILATNAYNIQYPVPGCSICPYTTEESVQEWHSDIILYISYILLNFYNVTCPAGVSPVKYAFLLHINGPGGSGKSSISDCCAKLFGFLDCQGEKKNGGSFQNDEMYGILQDYATNGTASRSFPQTILKPDGGSKASIETALMQQQLGAPVNHAGHVKIGADQKGMPRITVSAPPSHCVMTSNSQHVDSDAFEKGSAAYDRRIKTVTLAHTGYKENNTFYYVNNDVDERSEGKLPDDAPEFKGLGETGESVDEAILKIEQFMSLHITLSMIGAISLKVNLQALYEGTELYTKIKQINETESRVSREKVHKLLKQVHAAEMAKRGLDDSINLKISDKSVKVGIAFHCTKDSMSVLTNALDIEAEATFQKELKGIETPLILQALESEKRVPGLRIPDSPFIIFFRKSKDFILQNQSEIKSTLLERNIITQDEYDNQEIQYPFARKLPA